MDSLDALARLARLREALLHDVPLPDDDRRCLANGLGCFLGRRCGSLDQALGVDRLPGEHDARRVAAIDRRDEIIRQTLDDFALTPAALAAALAKYASTAWPWERSLPQCPVRYVGRLKERLWQILRLRDRLLSERQIRSIVPRGSLLAEQTAARI